MDLKEAAKGKKTLVPAAAVAALGAAAGWLLTSRPKALKKAPEQLKKAPEQLRNALPDMPEVSVSELTDDLRGRVESALGRGGAGDGRARAPRRRGRTLTPEQLETRLKARERRRKERRQTTRS